MASVTYNINGKYDGKAMNQAKSGLQSLAGEAKKAATAVIALVSTKALGGIKKVVDGSTQSFLNQNTALKSLSTAAQNAAIPLQNLAKIRQDMSHGNFFDDDSLNNALKLATNMQLAEEQIREVMTAATDMAASGIMPLDTAVRTLSQSYSGDIEQLAKIAPELKNLTKEELANGAAVDVLKGKYAGFADQMSNTFGGRETQFKNAFADLQSEVGGIIQSLRFVSQGKFLEPIQKMTVWLHENREQILTFVLALPGMMSAAFDGIKKMIDQTFSVKGFSNIFMAIGKNLVNNLVFHLEQIGTLLKLQVESFQNIFSLTFGNLAALAYNNFIVPFGNKFIESINKILEKVMDNKAVKWIAENIFKSKDFNGSNVITFRFDENKKDYTSLNDFATKQKNIFKDFLSDYKKASEKYAKNLKDNAETFSKFYKDTAEETAASIKAVLDSTDLPEDLKVALSEGAGIIQSAIENEDGTPVTTNSGNTGNGESNSGSPWASLLSSFGQIGSTIQAVIQGAGGWVAILIQFIVELVAKLKEISPAFNQVLDYMSTLVNEIAAPVADILDSFLPDVANVIKLLGRTVGKVIELIAPIAKLFLIGLLQTLLKTIAVVLTVIYNAVVAIHNLFSKKRNRWDYLSFDETTNVQSASSSYAEDVATAKTSTARNSITAAKDVYINITYSQSYVNGDARAIALAIRDEIKMAEKLGY